MGQMTIALKSFVVLMAPAINALLVGLASLAGRFQKLPKFMKVTIIVLLGVLAVIGPLTIGLGAMAFAVSSIIAILPMLSAGLAIFGVVSSPIWITAAALGAVAAAIYQTSTNWETLTGKGALKDFAGWATGADPSAGAGQTSLAQEAAVRQASHRIQQKKLSVSGNISVSAAEGSKVESADIGLNTGHQLSGAGASF
jgi:hypothetical protein